MYNVWCGWEVCFGGTTMAVTLVSWGATSVVTMALYLDAKSSPDGTMDDPHLFSYAKPIAKRSENQVMSGTRNGHQK